MTDPMLRGPIDPMNDHPRNLTFDQLVQVVYELRQIIADLHKPRAKGRTWEAWALVPYDHPDDVDVRPVGEAKPELRPLKPHKPWAEIIRVTISEKA